MIALAADCILLRRANGESEPMSSVAVAIKVTTDGVAPFDEAFVQEASTAVLHYFKNEQGKESVTLCEFSEALEKVLHDFKFSGAPSGDGSRHIESDLRQLAAESGKAFELNFFPRLRDELRSQLRQSPQVLRFRGLRGCVKQLAGARRWSARCQSLQVQIVEFLRECLSAEPHLHSCALVVE